MNIKFVSMSMFMAFALTFTACHKSGVYDSDSAKNVSDLKVPEGFDWSMSEDVSLTITSPVETSVSVFGDEECKELLATFPVSTEESTFTLNVKNGTEKLYVEYTKVDGSKSVLPVSISASRAAGTATVILPEGTGKHDKKQHVIFYPGDGWGTLFFEDMWPSKGDYDFNDMVASYKIQLYIENSKVAAIMVAARLNALGGHFPYQLCLQVDNLLKTEISDVDDYTESTSSDGTGKYKYEDDAIGDKALFSFDWQNKMGGEYGNYYNTEKGYKLDNIDKNIVAFIIYLNDPRDLDDFTSSSFNFFIRNTDENDNREIHLLGYEPTASFATGYDEMVKKNASLLSDKEYYRTSDGFVWGLKIPANVSHAVEKANFLDAYPLFREWVVSGGQKNPMWYESKVDEHCITFPK